MGRVLVTGATGFLGRHVVRALLRGPAACPVRCLVRDEIRAAGLLPGAVELVSGDVTNAASLRGMFRDVTAVVHCASVVTARETAEYRRVNVEGTRNIVAQCVTEGVGGLVYVGSAAIDGFAEARNAEEHVPRRKPATPVSRTRYEAEKVLMPYHEAGRIAVTILRPLFVYGEGDRFFIPAILQSLLRLPFLINRGRGSFSVISASDLAEVIARMVQSPPRRADNPVYHATDGSPVTLAEVARTLCETLGVHYPRLSISYGIAVPVMYLAGLRKSLFGADEGNGKKHSVSMVETRHRIHLVTRNHSFSNRKLNEALPGLSFVPFVEQFPAYLPYYRTVLSALRGSAA